MGFEAWNREFNRDRGTKRTIVIAIVIVVVVVIVVVEEDDEEDLQEPQ